MNGWSQGDAEGLQTCFEAALDILNTQFYVLGFYVSALSLGLSIAVLYIVLSVIRGLTK